MMWCKFRIACRSSGANTCRMAIRKEPSRFAAVTGDWSMCGTGKNFPRRLHAFPHGTGRRPKSGSVKST